MMWVCDYDHNPVCYDAMKCPVCELQEQLVDDNKNSELELIIETLESAAIVLQDNKHELEMQVKQLEAQLEDLDNERRKVG